MTTTFLTAQIPKFDTPLDRSVETPIFSNSQQFQEKLRNVIAKLERQDIGWLDILRAMALIAEQRGDDQVASCLEATALELKQNRKVIRDL